MAQHLKQQKMEITKDMMMGEIVKIHPGLADIMNKFGLHCTGCGVSAFESLEQGIMAHGRGEEEVELLVKELNDFLKNPVKNKKDNGVNSGEIIPIKFTDAAVKKLIALRDNDKETRDYGVRVMVLAGGCSGYQYGMDFEKEAQKDDQVINYGRLRVFVDAESQKILSGVTVDYVESLNETGFKFDNPNAVSSCGCGKSFN